VELAQLNPGRIFLLDPTPGVIVRVFIATVTQLLAARVMRIAQMHRHWEGWLFFNCLESRRNTVMRGPGLRRARDMKSGMSKDYTRLGIADHLYRLGGGDCCLEG